MPLALSERAMARMRAAIWLCDMCPYFARSHSTIFCGLLDTHGPPGAGPGAGGGGGGATGSGVRNVWAAAHAPVVSRSLPRTRQ